jgi:hypothetical protein
MQRVSPVRGKKRSASGEDMTDYNIDEIRESIFADIAKYFAQNPQRHAPEKISLNIPDCIVGKTDLDRKNNFVKLLKSHFKTKIQRNYSDDPKNTIYLFFNQPQKSNLVVMYQQAKKPLRRQAAASSAPKPKSPASSGGQIKRRLKQASRKSSAAVTPVAIEKSAAAAAPAVPVLPANLARSGLGLFLSPDKLQHLSPALTPYRAKVNELLTKEKDIKERAEKIRKTIEEERQVLIPQLEKELNRYAAVVDREEAHLKALEVEEREQADLILALKMQQEENNTAKSVNGDDTDVTEEERQPSFAP